MDKFVEQAFKDAETALQDIEYDAWMRVMKDPDVPHTAAAAAVGISKMNDLCRMAFATNNAQTLADYAHYLMLTGFHLGYTVRREDESK